MAPSFQVSQSNYKFSDHIRPCIVKATAVFGEVCWSGDNWSWVVLLGRVVVGRVEDIVEHVLLHLPNLGVTIEPALQ